MFHCRLIIPVRQSIAGSGVPPVGSASVAVGEEVDVGSPDVGTFTVESFEGSFDGSLLLTVN